ncbi:unnamed protein product [Candida verbasci]|uniref:Damage-regulated import facilitator 1 n=1 Tax=Candida verbasci TaxID=1227364 RepID=A0A9W4TZ55_9ASCO|nr:unnamed protein product [Candida verbasci]
MSQTKRSNNNDITYTQLTDQNTLNQDIVMTAMRIRKSIADGYKTSFNRSPLPQHLNQPPALTNEGSTRSSSNLEEWDSYYKIQNAPFQVLPEINPMKRKREDEVANFENKYGELKFNEEF